MAAGSDRGAQPAAFTVSTPLGDVAVRVGGQCVTDLAPLLLLHANPGDSRDFDAVIPALEREYTIVTID